MSRGKANGRTGGQVANAGHPEWPAAKVEMWDLARIREYEANPRTHPEAQLELLARSMREDGVTMPILVDETGVIIAGHGRIRAAAMNGFAQYPVVVARGWSEEQKLPGQSLLQCQASRRRDDKAPLSSHRDRCQLRGRGGSPLAVVRRKASHTGIHRPDVR